MLKAIFISILLLSVFAGHVRKPHKQLHKKKSQMYNSAVFEMQNIGDQDYHLDQEEAQNWAQVSADFGLDVQSIVEKQLLELHTESEYIPGVVGNIVDLSNNAGVQTYTIKDKDGNIIETETGDNLSKKLNDEYLEMLSKRLGSPSINPNDNNQS